MVVSRGKKKKSEIKWRARAMGVLPTGSGALGAGTLFPLQIYKMLRKEVAMRERETLLK